MPGRGGLLGDNGGVTPDLQPLSARSVMLSTLLGAHPAELPARALVRVGEQFGIAESTARVALTRLVAAGDLEREDGAYRLATRLLERQRRQDDAIHAATRPWDGEWEFVVITAGSRAAADRADQRRLLGGLRLAELREGVWLRPANLEREWPASLSDVTSVFRGRPEGDPVVLARQLWDLDAFAQVGRALVAGFEASHPLSADRFTHAAAIVRHLLADPILPPELLPQDWPGDALRGAYTGYQDELAGAAVAAGLA